MKHVIGVICAVLTASLGVSFATASSVAPWGESKAERAVMRDAVVQLSPSDRTALENELRPEVRLYNALELGANDEGDARAGAKFGNLANRYSSALRKVQGGLDVDQVECNGSAPARHRHFMRFSCSVTSEALRIPTAELVYPEDGGLPEISEGEPRIVDAVEASLSVRVTGKSSIAFRQVS